MYLPRVQRHIKAYLFLCLWSLAYVSCVNPVVIGETVEEGMAGTPETPQRSPDEINALLAESVLLMRVIPVDDSLGDAAAALSEPWACVEAAYTQRRRLETLVGGTLWILCASDDGHDYDFGAVLSRAAKVVITGASAEREKALREASAPGAVVIAEEQPADAAISDFSARHTDGEGFDDIVILAPRSAVTVGEAAKSIAFRGTMAR